MRSGAEYEEKIANFWITGKLESGFLINIFDFKGFDLRNYINQEVECLICAFLVDFKYSQSKSPSIDSITNVIQGIYINNYEIPIKWKDYDKFYSERSFAIKTNDGFFLLDASDIKKMSIREKKEIKLKEGQKINLYVGRFDLQAWYPLE